MSDEVFASQIRIQHVGDEYYTAEKVSWSVDGGILRYRESDGQITHMPLTNILWWEVGGPDAEEEDGGGSIAAIAPETDRWDWSAVECVMAVPVAIAAVLLARWWYGLWPW